MDVLKTGTGLNELSLDLSFQRPKLKLIDFLIESMNVQAIRYCHWKSNEHLAASMAGDTDLDILFDIDEKEKVCGILNFYNFKRFEPIRQRKYADIEDFLGMDTETGKIVHVHAHFRLTLGESYLKGYQLNLESEILESRVYDVDFGIFRSRPSFELILLFFRYAFKFRRRDQINLWWKKDVGYGDNIIREFNWLKQRCTDLEVKHVLSLVLNDYMPVYRIITSDFNMHNIAQLAGLIKKEFKEQRLYNPLVASIVRWYRELFSKVSAKLMKFSGLPVPRKRVHPDGGLVVALLGADGSGKSTLVSILLESFSKKIDVYKIYFGSGSSGASRSVQIFRKFKRQLIGNNIKLSVKKDLSKTDNAPSVKPGKISFVSGLFKGVEALLIARDKTRKIRRMEAARKKGMLVICDRFPQNQVKGRNDGPLLNEFYSSANILFRLMAKLESRLYKKTVKYQPDMAIKLIADARVLEARKPGQTALPVLEEKIEGIKNMQFSKNCKVISIDVSHSLEEVALSVKRNVWAAFT